MDIVIRRRRLFLIALASSLAAAACGGAQTGGPVGVSNAGEAHTPSAPKTATPAQRSNAIPSDYKTSMQQIGSGRFVSRGHAAGRFDVELYANDLGKSGYGTASGEFQVGARFVTAHFERVNGVGPADEAPGPLFMMEKMAKGYDAAHGDWRYVALSSQGELVQDGKIESCAGCHDDAGHDHVFPSN
ncbi:MAG TPA: cytochrome P460 family protein [Polyangiaceae bacterium]